MTSTAMHIYTSGTTGLPKAARIHHIKVIGSGVAMPTFYLNASEYTQERFYISMPLFHSAAMLVGIASTVYMGGTVVLRDKFSRSNFWKDCREHNVTTIQYIGELLRYLVNAPPGPDDKAHNVRLALGNGLRPDVWAAFQTRFGVPRIGEFYASTEGNATLLNNQNKFGAVGFISPLVATKYPVKLARYDVATDALVRDPESGLCIECSADEKGELLGQIISDDVTRRFDGYSNKSATEKKVVRDVFVKGDAYFRSGDLLRRDAEGYVYFVDRIGDTFRWKGENVSTTEVEEMFEAGASGDGRFGITEVSVYGAAIEGCDGRAGMAAVVLGEKTGGELDLVALRAHLRENLPPYAAPLFVRILTGGMEVTATFKNRKVSLKEEGVRAYEHDPVYFRDESKGVEAFVRVDEELYAKINGGQCKL
uniref:AMP-dependent synthetase/ligase domain-containing protein n=1 Tax=Florenciella parvula TaxID=236787 RepID=A0A7S2D0U8_9STRA